MSTAPNFKRTKVTLLGVKPNRIADNAFDVKLLAGHTGKAIQVLDSNDNVLYSVDASGNVSPAGLVQISTSQDTHNYAGGFVPAATTSGTDTAGIATKIWVSEVFIPANATITGVSYLIGSVGGTDKVVVFLFDSAGNVLATSALDSSVTVGTTATMQRVPFTAPYAAKGPGLFYVGVATNGTTAKIRTQVFGDHNCGNVTWVFNTAAAIAPPSTFTASTGPVAMTY